MFAWGQSESCLSTRQFTRIIQAMPFTMSRDSQASRILRTVVRVAAATPPLFLVGTLGVCREQIGFLAPGSSLSGPSRDVLRRLQWYCRMAPLGQWRDRAGLSPDFPIKLSRAPVLRRIHLCSHLIMLNIGCLSAILTSLTTCERVQ